MKICGSSYNEDLFSPKKLARTIKRVAKNVRRLQKKLKFTAIAFRGSSGSAVAFPVSALIGIDLIYVRKEKNHHGSPLEGSGRNVKRYIILDDFISTGTTVKAILGKINAMHNREWYDADFDPITCVGIVLYDDHDRVRKDVHYHGKTIPVFKV